MNWKRGIARTLAEISALSQSDAPRSGVRILLYHAVGSRLADDPYGISISFESFWQQMEMLALRETVEVVSFDALPSALDRSESQQQENKLLVAVTFDDGYKDNLHAAAPVLLRLKIPFTVFVTSSFIQNESPDYLTALELRELAAMPGVTIGSHGVTHRPLAQCDDATLSWELNVSRHSLEDIIGKSVTALSYPHGSVSGRVRDAARQAGYVLAGSSCFDINKSPYDPLNLCRCEIVARDSARVFLQKLNGAWDWKRWRTSLPTGR